MNGSFDRSEQIVHLFALSAIRIAEVALFILKVRYILFCRDDELGNPDSTPVAIFICRFLLPIKDSGSIPQGKPTRGVKFHGKFPDKFVPDLKFQNIVA
jgi:hypothetical protein